MLYITRISIEYSQIYSIIFYGTDNVKLKKPLKMFIKNCI